MTSTTSSADSPTTEEIEIQRGDTLSRTFSGLGSVAARENLWFTVKRQLSDTDAESLIQIDLSTGLLYLNGSSVPAARQANGSIVVDDEDAGDITVTLKPAEADDLPDVDDAKYDVQMLTTLGVVSTLVSGDAVVSADVTRAVA